MVRNGCYGYGAERVGEGTRYRVPCLTGGLFPSEGRLLAKTYRDDGTAPLLTGGGLGIRAGADLRRGAVDGNVLGMRTRASGERVVREVTRRLSALTLPELGMLADFDTMPDERRAIMWTACCRYYALVGEFATDVLRDRWLIGRWSGDATVGYDDFDRFVRGRAMWHPELGELSPGTLGAVRSGLFRTMREAGLLDGGNVIVPALFSPAVERLFAASPGTSGFFPGYV